MIKKITLENLLISIESSINIVLTSLRVEITRVVRYVGVTSVTGFSTCPEIVIQIMLFI